MSSEGFFLNLEPQKISNKTKQKYFLILFIIHSGSSKNEEAMQCIVWFAKGCRLQTFLLLIIFVWIVICDLICDLIWFVICADIFVVDHLCVNLTEWSNLSCRRWKGENKKISWHRDKQPSVKLNKRRKKIKLKQKDIKTKRYLWAKQRNAA